MNHLLASARAQPRRGVRGVISPHAGYAFSGAVAAEAFACLKDAGGFRRALIVGPSHFVPFRGIAGPPHAAFETALGTMPVDQAEVDALVRDKQIIMDDHAHARDHALEVQLPFLHVGIGPTLIVPLLIGHTDAQQVAAVIERLWDEKTLLVVSSDLSHFEPYETARHHDLRTAEAIEALDEGAIGPGDACGHLAIRGALLVAARRGLNVARLDLRNSGDADGGRNSVVGYGAWAFLEEVPP